MKFVKIMVIFIGIVLLLAIATTFYLRLPLFGGTPSAERLARLKNSANYKDGQFQNLEITPSFKEGESVIGNIYKFLFQNKSIRKPKNPLPVQKQDLFNLPASDLMIWFGHSSYLLQIEGKKILVDPVFSAYASPIPGSNKPFLMQYNYKADDFPQIDVLIISHDHYDHLDYETMVKMKSKIKHIVCGLGVGSHFERWGFQSNQITELDWYDHSTQAGIFQITATPARHFSGRKLKRNVTLWSSFVLKTAHYNLFLGGDSGYGMHFKSIGDAYGPFDLAILENGQYNEAWHYIHTLPNELIQEVSDLKAKRFLPVHAAKFALALHHWKEPLEQAVKHAEASGKVILTPEMGEIVYLSALDKQYDKWWEGLE